MANDFDRLTCLEAAQSQMSQSTTTTTDVAPQAANEAQRELAGLEVTGLEPTARAGEMAHAGPRPRRHETSPCSLFAADARHRRSTRKGPPAFSN